MNAGARSYSGTQSLTDSQQRYVAAGYLRAYALLTQVRPRPVNDLVGGLYDGLFSSLSTKRLCIGEEESINDVVQECFEERGYRLVVRDETGSSSLVMRAQMPTSDIPTGGDMDLPLDAYLRLQGIEGSFAKRIHNALLRRMPHSRSYAMRLAVRRAHGSASGYAYSSVLTLGGAFAFISEQGMDNVRHGHNIGPKAIDVLSTYVLNNAKVKELANEWEMARQPAN